MFSHHIDHVFIIKFLLVIFVLHDELSKTNFKGFNRCAMPFGFKHLRKFLNTDITSISKNERKIRCTLNNQNKPTYLISFLRNIIGM